MIKHEKKQDGDGQTTGAGEAKADNAEDLMRHELTPAQIGAIRALREQRLGEIRTERGKHFTRDDIKELRAKVERRKANGGGES